ncbi:hypothetical protein FEM54_25450 [Pseudomonas edaphica]|uniref:Uncharacterized protein n=1 Tax=Pseudomonas edaphica TaxID=2006980 RepID=A0ABY2TYH1_9PSED|nr:hypothetical protein FEM54_25450 [Pseudomonas edaphica]
MAEPWPSQASQLPLKGRSAFDLAVDLAFDFDLSRPVKPRWPAFGYTEPRRGAEWWGEDFLVTFVSLQK